MNKLHALALAFLCAAAAGAGCNEEPTNGRSEANHTEAGSCANACGEQSEDGCWCDAECAEHGDCCGDKALVCDACEDGELVVTTSYEPSTDDKECAVEVQHCVTKDGSACPQLSPLPPGFCSEGTVVAGPRSLVPSADGMECSLPSVHCVTNDLNACPLVSPRPPSFCADGEIVRGDSSFIPSTDGMECEIPSVHCVTTNAQSCGGGSCEGGRVAIEEVFTAAGDDGGSSCVEERSHCVTDDFTACPLRSPLPPSFCANGTVIAGPPSYLTSTDGMECEMPSIHCVTNDWSACPQRSPLPPNYCADGEVKKGPSKFIPSADGMECEMPSVHCVRADVCD